MVLVTTLATAVHLPDYQFHDAPDLPTHNAPAVLVPMLPEIVLLDLPADLIVNLLEKGLGGLQGHRR